MDNTQLIQRIDKLEKEILSLRQTNTIPLEVDRAFQGRNFAKISPEIFPYADYFYHEGFLKIENPEGNVPYFLPFFIIDESTP